MSFRISWSVYDNAKDEAIGVWNSYEDAYDFYMDHVEVNGCEDWELFPFEECLITVSR